MRKTEPAWNKVVYYAVCDAAWKCDGICKPDSPRCAEPGQLDSALKRAGWLLLEKQRWRYDSPEFVYICPAHRKALLEMLK